MKIWYAAYGSNMSRDRFEYYLSGGRPDGATHTYPGCRDDSPPSADVASEIDAELAFGGTSQTWNGGVAFIRPGRGVRALARLYLLTHDQFCDVIAQENHLEPGSLDLPTDSCVIEGGHMYGTVLRLGHREVPPVLAISQSVATMPASPSLPYLRYVAEGLRETHGLTASEVVDYLWSRPGIHGALQPDDIAAAVS